MTTQDLPRFFYLYADPEAWRKVAGELERGSASVAVWFAWIRLVDVAISYPFLATRTAEELRDYQREYRGRPLIEYAAEEWIKSFIDSFVPDGHGGYTFFKKLLAEVLANYSKIEGAY